MSNGAGTFSQKAFNQSLKKAYSFYTIGFVSFVVLLGIAEALGMPNRWIGYCFLFATILLYGGIGVMSRTAMRTASMATSKQSQGLRAAITGIGASALRP